MLKSSYLKKTVSVLTAVAVLGTTLIPGSWNKPQDVSANKVEAVYYDGSNLPVTQQYRNVMYYGDWSTGAPQGYFNPNLIPGDKITHLNFAFLDFDRRGNLLWGEKGASVDDVVGIEGAVKGAENAGILSGLVQLRAKYPNLRVGVSVGGWAKSGDFSTVARNATSRKRFVDNLIDFVQYAKLDFIDVDWEYPGEVRQPEYMDNQTNEGTPQAGPDDKANYVILLKEIRAGLDELSAHVTMQDYTDTADAARQKMVKKYYELSVAISANERLINAGIDIPEVFAVCDFVNVMTYDMNGQWNHFSGHHSALKTNPNLIEGDTWTNKMGNSSVDATVKFLVDQTAPKNKIVIGCAFYSRGWENVTPTSQAIVSGIVTDQAIAGLPGLGGIASPVTPGTDGYQGNADGTGGRGADNFQPTVWGDGGIAAGIWPAYNRADLEERYPDLIEYWDPVAEAAYLYNGKAFFSIENERSIAAKAEYVKANQLGGMIAWMQSQDAETNPGSNVRDKLTTAMKVGLLGTAPLQPWIQFPEGPDFNQTMQFNRANNTLSITLRNKSRLSESNEVLKEVEQSYKTIMTPTLYMKVAKHITLSAPSNAGFTVAMNTSNADYNVALIYLYEKMDMIRANTNMTFALNVKSSDTSKAITFDDSMILTQRIVPTGNEFYFKVLNWGVWMLPTYFQLPAPKAIANPTLAVTKRTIKMANKKASNQYRLTIKNDIKGSTYKWTSGKTSVATVSSNGTVTALRPGTAAIKCVITTGTKRVITLNASITVTGPKLQRSAITVLRRRQARIGILNKVAGATYQYTSARSTVARVYRTGAILGVRRGTTTIRVKITFPKASGLPAMTFNQRVTVR